MLHGSNTLVVCRYDWLRGFPLFLRTGSGALWLFASRSMGLLFIFFWDGTIMNSTACIRNGFTDWKGCPHLRNDRHEA